MTSVALDQDLIPPTADAGIDMLATVGMEVAFDGTQSSDNDGIKSYLWDFGDGSVSNIAQPRHVYNEPGTYTVMLTVSDNAGNTASDSITVTVYPEQQVGTVEVRVIDSRTGAAIPGASVYVDFPGDEPKLFNADGNGVATIVAFAGNYNISAYKTGYLPAEVNVRVEQYQKPRKQLR